MGKRHWYPDDAIMIKDTMENYIKGRTKKCEIEYRMLHKVGTYRWRLSNGEITRDQAGNPIRWTGINIDIIELKRAEELYLESEKRIRELAEAVPDHSFNIDITELKRAEELYLESEKKIRELVEAVSDHSFNIDEEGRYIEALGNQDSLPSPKEQFRELSFLQALQKHDAQFVLSEVGQAFESGKTRSNIRELKLGREKYFISGHTVPLSYKVDGKSTVAIIEKDIAHQSRTEIMLQVTYEQRLRSEFIYGIINGKEADDDNLAYLSSKIGLDLRLPVFVCHLLSSKFNLNDGNSQGERTNSVQKFKDVIMDALSDHHDCVAWDCGEGLGVLCQAAFKAADWAQSKEIAALIRDRLVEYDSSIVISVGVSDVHVGVKGLKNSCRQALSAALAAQCQVLGERNIIHYREAGLFQFIPELFGRDSAKEYIKRNIGKLLAYDREKKINYLSTLEELLRGSSVRKTADKQFLHPKTIVFRQKRIGTILDVDLGDYQIRLALAVAIQLYKLINVYGQTIND